MESLENKFLFILFIPGEWSKATSEKLDLQWKQNQSLSLSFCLTSLITTWRNVHYFSSPFVSEPLLEEQESEGVRLYSLAPPWRKSRLIIMLKLPEIQKGRERETESGSKHSGNLNQLCKLHFSCRKSIFFCIFILNNWTLCLLVICKCSHTLILSANKHSSRFRKRKP